MKTLIIAVLLCTAGASYMPLVAQSNVNPPVFGSFANDNINFNSAAYRNNATNRFMLSWNWGSQGGWLDSALGINAYHANGAYFHPEYTSRPWDGNLVLFFHQYLDWGYAGAGAFNTQSMWYHPELTLDSTSAFTPMAGDPQGAVFGWANKAFGQRGTGADEWRWMLKPDTLTQRHKVLWNMWKGTGFAWQHWNVGYDGTTAEIEKGGLNDPNSLQRDTNLYQPRNGKRWYLTISLKASDSVQLAALPLGSPILALKIPYTLYDTVTKTNSTGFIRFDSLPSTAANSLYTIAAPRNAGDLRGRSRRNALAPTKPNEFIITREMLLGQNNTTGITLSAFFRVDGVQIAGTSIYIDNPKLQPESNYTGDPTTVPNEYITKLGIEAFYYPNADIAIDYMRLETQQAQRVFMGRQDMEVRDTVQAITARVMAAQAPPAHAPKIYRFYNVEERREQWWGMMRYYNALLDWRCTAEINSKHNPPAHYLHATGMKEFWQGDAYQTVIGLASPTMRQSIFRKDSTFGYEMGYEGHTGEVYSRPQVERSHYECALPTYQPKGSSSWIDLPANPFAGNNTAWFSPDTNLTSHAHLFMLEKLLYNSYYLHKEMLYGALPWWTNVWIGSQYWMQDSNRTQSPPQPLSLKLGLAGCDRPCTGEEARLEMSIPLLLGVKGYSFWRNSFMINSKYLSFTCGVTISEDDTVLQKLPLNFASPEAALLSPLTGGDWVPTTENHYEWWGRWFKAHRHNWSLMSIDSNHIYLGKRSQRLEMYKLTKTIHAHEAEILALQLQAWYAKGWIRMYSQHPSHTPTSDTLLHHFVQSSQLRSRPLGRVHAGTNTPWYENEVAGQDSTFADLTLLKKDTVSMDSVFYLGVQNRRTDPLWHDPSYANDEMILVPTAEWDNLKQNGGRYWKDTTFKDTTFWRQKFWARQGCREIVIPFNYTHPDSQPRLLHVQQVGGGVNGLDTIVRQNALLALRFEPGEGKLLRITVQPARASIAQGNLNNSNQRKMVCFPIMRAVGGRLVASDSLRYHLVYHRFDSLAQRLNVYYRRSVPYSQKQTHTPGLEWEGEVNLSANPILKLDNRVATYSCGYPTLVVRQDTVDLDNTTIPPSPTIKVYVVYACADPDAATKFRIVENVFQAQSAAPNYYPAREIDSAWGRERSSYNSLEDDDFLSKWAAPSINACYNGNYYAWADSASGIVTRWKEPNLRSFNANSADKNAVRYRDDLENTICQHPALNTYSRLGLGENDCALVWEERLSPEAPAAYIPYTRVKLMPGVVPLRTGYFLPLHRNPRLDLQNKTRPDSMVVLMNTDTVVAQQTFPVVYRGVEEYIPANNGSRPLEIVQWDRVAWEVQNEVIKGIELRGVDAADSNYATSPPGDDYWAVWFPTFVWSNTRNLLSPQLAQGGRAWLAPDSLTNISDSAVVLNFHSWRQLSDTPGDFTLWQFQYGYWSSLIRWFVELDQATNIAAYQPNISIVGGGRNPRLSASLWKPGIALAEQNWLYNLWNDNRRVYQAPFLASSSIFSSAENFYKQHAEEEDHPLHYAGYVLQRDSGRAFKTLLSQVNAGGKDLLFRVQPSLQNGNMTLKTDTIYSDWFRAGNTTKLRAFTLGINNPCVRVQVERRKENGNDRGERFELPYLAAGNDTAKRRNSFTLLRGGNKLYRLALINTCGNNLNSPRYTEELQLDGLTAADREADLAKAGNEGGSQDDIVVDLGDVVQGNDVLALQPNPANDKFTLRFDGLPEDYEDTHYTYNLGIYTQLGQRVYSGSIRAGESQTITTSGLLPGVYRVQVRGSRGAVSLPMVIMR